jgi:predicted GNAT family acetyltransferase
MSDSLPVLNNPSSQRFEITIDNQTAFLTYQRKQDTLVLIHTEVPAALAGRGVGSALARAALDQARSEGLSIVPRCPFVVSYVKRHPEYNGLLEAK